MGDYAEREEESQDKGTIAGQLFTDLASLIGGRFDRRKLSRVIKPTQLPKGFRKLVLLESYSKTFDDPAIQAIVDAYLDLTVSVDGLGREEALKAESLLQGIQIRMDKTPPPKPGMVDKLLNTETNKDYQEYLDWKEMRELSQSE